MRRFFVPSDEKLDLHREIELKGDEFHHLKNVCRLEAGECVELLDGKGHIALAEIDAITKKSAILVVKSVSLVAPPGNPKIEIILSIPRFQKMDLIIQKCVELGAHTITPVVSDRSFVKALSKDLESKRERWEKIAAEACKQAGRAWPMFLSPISKLDTELEELENTPGLFLYEGEGQIDIHQCLSSFPRAPEHMKIFIGAEGGFSPREVEAFQRHHLKPITLGPLVLRVETACITILSVIQYHFGLMR